MLQYELSGRGEVILQKKSNYRSTDVNIGLIESSIIIHRKDDMVG